jgi:hypothetical protein
VKITFCYVSSSYDEYGENPELEALCPICQKEYEAEGYKVRKSKEARGAECAVCGRVDE